MINFSFSVSAQQLAVLIHINKWSAPTPIKRAKLKSDLKLSFSPKDMSWFVSHAKSLIRNGYLVHNSVKVDGEKHPIQDWFVTDKGKCLLELIQHEIKESSGIIKQISSVKKQTLISNGDEQ